MRLGRRVWRPEDTLDDTIERELTDSYGEPVREGGMLRWSGDRLDGLQKQKIVFDTEENEISVSTESYSLLYVLVLVLPLAFSYFVLNSDFAQGGLFMIFSFFVYTALSYWLFIPRRVEGLKEIGFLSDQENKPYFFVLTLVGMLSMWYKFQTSYPNGLVNRFTILILLIFLGYSISYDLIPFVSVKPGLRILATPVTAMFWLLIPPILFVLFAFQPGYLYLQGQFHQSIFQNMTLTLQNVSIITDMYGSIPSIDAIDLAVAETSITYFQIMVLVMVVVLALMAIQARRQLSGYDYVKITKFESSKIRIFGFFAFLVSNTAVILTAIPAAAILFYGLFGKFPFSGIDLLYTQAFTHQPLDFEIETVRTVNNSSVTEPVLIQESTQIRPKELVSASYEVLDTAFQYAPVMPPRFYSMFFFGFLFSPQILLGYYWLYSLSSGIYRKAEILRDGEPLERDSGVVPEGIEVLVIEAEEEPAPAIAHPMSILFGLRNYIVISGSVKKELTPDELDAILAHEVYHIQNQDLKINAAAKITSLTFGGSNAILAFYDYPKIEEEADDYAREEKGVRNTVVAIDKIDVLNKRSGGIVIPTLFPGMIDYEPYLNKSKAELESIYEKISLYMSSPYQLLFGRIIVNTAHADAETRIQRIESKESE